MAPTPPTVISGPRAHGPHATPKNSSRSRIPTSHPELVLACLLACLPACLPACLLTVRGPELVPKVFILGPVGAVLGLLWGPLGGLLGPCWGSLVPSWALLGSQWQQTRVAPISLAPLRGRKVAFRRRLGPS